MSGVLGVLAAADVRVSQRLRDATDRRRGARLGAALVAHSADWWWWLLGAAAVWHVSAVRPGLVAMVAAIVVTALVVQSLKWIVRRRRPSGRRDVLSRYTDPHSFPSGHAARATALGVVGIALGPPWIGLALLPWAALVATVRVALGVHYVSDAVAGVVVGIVCGLVVVARVGALPS